MKHISISEIAELTELDRATIRARLKDLSPKAEGRAQTYPAREALLTVFELSLDKIKAEQLRYETARANRIELQNAKLQGEVVAIEDVAGVVEKEYAAVRASLLSIPSKASIELSALTSPIEIKKRLEDLINETLEELTADQASN